MPKTATPETEQSPFDKLGEVPLTPELSALAVLDDAFGPAGWRFQIGDQGYPPNYVSVRGTLTVGDISRDGFSLIPLEGSDPNAAAQAAYSEALRHAIAQLPGAVVQFQDFPVYEKTDRYGNSAKAAPVAAVPSAPTAPPPASGGGAVCQDCHQPIIAYTTEPRNGKPATHMTVQKQIEMTTRSASRPLCRACNSAFYKANKS